MAQKGFFTLFLHFWCLVCLAQNPYPKDYFISPLDIPLTMSGNFGEIRPNHLHSGIDLKTEGKEGLPVFAAADGYISRIKVSPFGYGNALYITHPNGYVTVYGHLQNYNAKITEYVRKEQYKRESFEVDLFPAPNELKVKQKDIIALSGNSGGSEGPHLHFEIRDDKSEWPINPLFFGLNIPDTVKPSISLIEVYPLNEISFVNNRNIPRKVEVQKDKKTGIFSLSSKDTIRVHGIIGFGLITNDTENGSSNPNGSYSVALNIDGQTIYEHNIDKFSFDQTRYVNAHIDYAEKIKNSIKVQRSFILANNKLPIYKIKKRRGIYVFNDDSIHRIKYTVKDIYNNTSELNFFVLSDSKVKMRELAVSSPNYAATFHFDRINTFKTENISIELPPNVLYEDLKFDYFMSDSIKGVSPIHHIHYETVPLHGSFSLFIKGNVPDSLRKKALIVSLDEKGKPTNEWGEWTKNGVLTKTRSFGNFTISIDTVAPTIKAININADKNVSKNKTLEMSIYDNLSGIASYLGTMDNKWVLFEYDAKERRLFYTFDDSIKSGEHTLELTVKDNKGNTSKYNAIIKR